MGQLAGGSRSSRYTRVHEISAEVRDVLLPLIAKAQNDRKRLLLRIEARKERGIKCGRSLRRIVHRRQMRAHFTIWNRPASPTTWTAEGRTRQPGVAVTGSLITQLNQTSSAFSIPVSGVRRFLSGQPGAFYLSANLLEHDIARCG